MSDSHSAKIEPLNRSKDVEFYMSLVTFEVQGSLFRVPIDAFKTRSDAFRDMFSLPVGAGPGDTIVEGRSDDSPIVLEGVEAEDFRALLRFLYPKNYFSNPAFTQKEWIGIHALAHMWRFKEAEDASKAFLVDMDDTLTKFELATRYEYDDWLRKAYKELAYRPNPLSIEETERVGIHSACRIAHMREARWAAQTSSQVLQKNGIYGDDCQLCGTEFPSRRSSMWGTTQDDNPTESFCKPCGITFYDSKDVVENVVSQRVDAAILTIVFEKIIGREEPKEETKPESVSYSPM